MGATRRRGAAVAADDAGQPLIGTRNKEGGGVMNVRKKFRAIMAGNLATRVPLRGTQDELDRLSETIKAMLDRIADLLENLRQISNDIAHDLRTPLGRLRQGLEDAKTRAASKSDYEQAIDHAVEEADALLNTFSALLRIAQIEAGAQRAAFRAVDIARAMKGARRAGFARVEVEVLPDGRLRVIGSPQPTSDAAAEAGGTGWEDADAAL